MRLELPVPPGVNSLYATVKGRRVKSAEGRRYQQGVRLRALSAGMRPLSGPVCVHVAIYRARRAGDLDGYLKSLLDSLTGVAWEDDSQVEEIHAARFDDKENPRAVVSVEEMVPSKWFIEVPPFDSADWKNTP